MGLGIRISCIPSETAIKILSGSKTISELNVIIDNGILKGIDICTLNLGKTYGFKGDVLSDKSYGMSMEPFFSDIEIDLENSILFGSYKTNLREVDYQLRFNLYSNASMNSKFLKENRDQILERLNANSKLYHDSENIIKNEFMSFIKDIEKIYDLVSNGNFISIHQLV